jgi:PTH1 family peptidyl-tRNA hydrolase
MKIICGLGNPGREYVSHRHNVGFLVVNQLAERFGIRFDQDKFEARLGQGTVGDQRLLLLEPQTFMNRSGQALGQAARFYKVRPESVLVIHDELDLPLGRLQLKRGGGAGGHNGLRSILEEWGEDAFARLRFGVGKPEGPNAKERVVGHVLSAFSREEAPLLAELVDRAVEAAQAWVKSGLEAAMNLHNRR